MSTRRSRTLVAVVVLVVATAAGGATLIGNTEGQSEPTRIETCTTISEPGTYVLTKDIENGGSDGGFAYISETCITIASDDVVFDAQGHTIDGYGITDTTGIGTAEGAELSDVTVKNARVRDWNRGVYLGNTDGATVQNVNASDNSFGVFVENARDTTVRDSTVTGNFVGIYHTNTRGNAFEGNTVRDNRVEDVVWERASETGDGNENATTTASEN